MGRTTASTRWTIAAAGVAVIAAWSLDGLTAAIDAGLHAGYARALAGESATQSVVLVDADDGVDDGVDREALAAALVADGPRLVLDPEGWTGCGLRGSARTCLAEHVPGDRSEESGAWVRPGSPVFAALAELGAARGGPLSVRYVVRLPTVAGERVARAEIPAGTFAGRVVVVGRAGPEARVVATPLGPMSPAQVEAQALLGVLDGAARAGAPGWLRALLLAGFAVATATAAGRGARAVRVVAAAWLLALAVDAGLYASGVVALGAAGPLVASAAAATVWIVQGRARELRGRPVAASGLHKVSGA
ncbi:MAG: hypothetical protein JNL82_35800 [Myxococcales bacterium]|nr:hypothetical protein [Myxococcales bacterium]